MKRSDCHWQKTRYESKWTWFTENRSTPSEIRRRIFDHPETLQVPWNHIEIIWINLFILINSQTSWNMEYHLASCINIGNLNAPEVFGHLFLRNTSKSNPEKYHLVSSKFARSSSIKYGLWKPTIYRTQQNMTLQNGGNRETGPAPFCSKSVLLPSKKLKQRGGRCEWSDEGSDK